MAAGWATDTSGAFDFALSRYNSDGSLDGTFGNGGKVTTALSGHEGAEAVIRQPDGKLVAAGWTGPSSVAGPFNLALVRFNANGSLDASFGTGGKVIGPSGGADVVVCESDGKLLVGAADGFVFRYNASGSLDTTFGIGGGVATTIGNEALLLQSDGKFLAAGNGVPNGFAVTHYNPDGTIDGSFGTGGIVTTGVGATWDFVEGAALQSDGKIVVVGGASDEEFAWMPPTDFAIVRYTSDGTLDGTFGSGGKVRTSIPETWANSSAGVAVQPDGKIVAAGYSDYRVAVVRYLGGTCGNGSLEGGEQCDGSADTACPGRCLSDCTCSPPASTVTPTPTATVTPTPTDTPIPALISGKKILIKDNADHTKRKVIFLSKDTAIDTTPSTGIDPVANGATVQVYNASGSDEAVCFCLPSAGGSWRASGAPPRLGFKYKDTRFTNGPCNVAAVKDAKLLKSSVRRKCSRSATPSTSRARVRSRSVSAAARRPIARASAAS